jgi:hypothetical protein
MRSANLFACLLGLILFNLAPAAAAREVLVEAESFADPGGWVIDTQFIEIMGSPYLMAHGLGEPVKDATTTVRFPGPGNYRVWVRTKDWVARWDAPGAPGRFQVLVDGQALKETFGTRGARWHWHEGGTVQVRGSQATLALRDLTGFNGRCDAILFSDDPSFIPPDDATVMAAWRKRLLGLPANPIEEGPFDLVVIGGGYAGTCAAISAARLGCSVALIQNRPVLGGNGSSEIRVWPMGRTRLGLYPHLGEIVEELALNTPKLSPGTAEEFHDENKVDVVGGEKNIRLFLNTHAYAVEMKDGRIAAVLALDTRTSQVRRFAGRLFADCTGHATIGALAGAEHTIKETGHMGMSNMWRWHNADEPTTFAQTPWALDIDMNDFPYPVRFHGQWFWETGFDRHPINDLEHMRDWNLRAVFGAFNAMKNRSGRDRHPNAKLEWIAYIGGTRQSRQIMGDVVLTQEDIVNKVMFPDGCVPTTWDIDLHYPDRNYNKKYPHEPFIAMAVFGKGVDRNNGYPVPYRCFYSKNIENLFMAGRNISVTHEALGTIRVMKTGGMMGEVVGKAASISTRHLCTPREVYQNYLDELKDLMSRPGASRRDSLNGELYVPADARKFPPVRPLTVEQLLGASDGLNPAKLEGIIIDDAQAKFTGSWSHPGSLTGFVGRGYRYAQPNSNATARFEFTVPASGRFEVRYANQPHENRASNARLTVTSAEGSREVTVNLREKPPIPPTFVSLGIYSFEAGRTYAVEISAQGANGLLHADAVQVVPAK